MDIPPTVQRPEGRKPQCGSSGVSQVSAGALQLEQELGRMAAGGVDRASTLLPWVFVIPQSLLHLFFFLGHVPISQMGNLHIPKVSQPGSGRAGSGYPENWPGQGATHEGVGHPSPQGLADLASFHV